MNGDDMSQLTNEAIGGIGLILGERFVSNCSTVLYNIA